MSLSLLVAVVLVGLGTTLGGLRAQAQAPPPPLPHPVTGREACLLCHGQGKVRPFPTNHSSFPEAMCLNCHAGATPSPQVTPSDPATSTPTAGPTVNIPTPTPASPSPGTGCLACHGVPGQKLTLASGEELDIYVAPGPPGDSPHSQLLSCEDCHLRYDGYPHPALQASNRREYTLTHYESCKRCHYANYTRTLDSIHFSVLATGNTSAPTCVDCHSAHSVSPPSQPRARISQTCSECHQGIYDVYLTSVHGRALVNGSSNDVPVCTDCHGSHRIQDPRLASFKVATPELCGRCHGDAALMKKYGLSSAVLRTYLQDFHGTTVRLYGKGQDTPETVTAVCTDCHGVHDITATQAPGSRVMKTNLVQVCRQCHTDANPTFPDAWLSHYDPSPTRAPLVFSIRLFYRILIPFIIGGLVIHILIDLWRWVTNR